MHFKFRHMIFMATICLIFPNVYCEPQNDCNELSVSATEIFSSRSETNCRPKEQRDNAAKNEEEDKNIPGIVNFLTSDTDFSLFNSNEKVIDILKSAVNSNDDKESQTKDGRKMENGMENSVVYTTNKPNDKIETKDKPLPSATPATIATSNIFYPNYNNNIDILKSTAGSLLNQENEKDHGNDSENSTTKNYVSQDKAEPYEVSNKTEAQTTSTEIILSEITNLSRDGGKGDPLGQKIEFKLSSKDSGETSSNLAGKEILKNTTGICGYLLGKRISFAEPTTLMEFPWTALLLYNTNIRYHCGGSLITTKYVLTAAHCVAQQFYELTGVRLGEYDISEPIDCAPDVAGSKICGITVDVDVVKIIVHHDYSHLSFKNDIALLRLDKEYLGRSFYPICLPAPEMMYDRKTATVAGWGATEKAIRSSILLKATVPVFDIAKCREVYRYNVFNDSTEICASGANEVDVCKGDSGGAIFYDQDVRGKSRFFQLGIISLGVRGCGDKRFLPAVFTKLNGFYKWIENNLEY